MLRIILGIFAGVLVWPIGLVSSELLLSAVWAKFGVQQRAFQAVIENGGTFAPETSYLITHILCGSLASALAGFLSAFITGETKRSPLIVGLLVTGVGLLKAVLSWSYVPLWYHIVFTALLIPMAMFGGRLRSTTKSERGE